MATRTPTSKVSNADTMLTLSSLIKSGHRQNTVCVDFESNLNDRNACWCGGNSVQDKLADLKIIFRIWIFALVDFYSDGCLVIFNSGVVIRFTSWDPFVFWNQNI